MESFELSHAISLAEFEIPLLADLPPAQTYDTTGQTVGQRLEFLESEVTRIQDLGAALETVLGEPGDQETAAARRQFYLHFRDHGLDAAVEWARRQTR